MAGQSWHDLRAVYAGLEQFDGRALVEMLVVTFGEPHAAHAACAQFAQQAVAADRSVALRERRQLERGLVLPGVEILVDLLAQNGVSDAPQQSGSGCGARTGRGGL